MVFTKRKLEKKYLLHQVLPGWGLGAVAHVNWIVNGKSYDLAKAWPDKNLIYGGGEGRALVGIWKMVLFQNRKLLSEKYQLQRLLKEEREKSYHDKMTMKEQQWMDDGDNQVRSRNPSVTMVKGLRSGSKVKETPTTTTRTGTNASSVKRGTDLKSSRSKSKRRQWGKKLRPATCNCRHLCTDQLLFHVIKYRNQTNKFEQYVRLYY